MTSRPAKSAARSPRAAAKPLNKPAPAAERSPAPSVDPAGASRTPFTALLFDLISLNNLMRRNQEHFAHYIGVSVPRFLILRVLEDNPGATVGQLATRLEVTSQFVTLESGKLIEQGLVVKRPSETDRRSVVLDLSPAGQQLLKDLQPLREQTNAHMFRSLDNDDVAKLHAIVLRLLADGRDGLHRLDAPGWREQRAPSLGKLNPGAR